MDVNFKVGLAPLDRGGRAWPQARFAVRFQAM
jgi:hypothetical protein